jgi:hypothetical protein
MNGREKKRHDRLVGEIEDALQLGRYIGYGEMYGFVNSLEKVAEQIASMKDDNAGLQPVRLYEVFLAGCHEKIEECDESGGNLGMFFQDLFCNWIKSRQSVGLPAEETVAQILKWMENDDYGLCFRIEMDIAKVINRDGYDLLIDHFLALIENALTDPTNKKTQAPFDYPNEIRLPAMSLKDLYEARKDVRGYAALCQRLGSSPRDCERLAEMEIAKKHWSHALTWAEKGVALEP